MIFISKNEDGILAWQSILDDKKTVTRRFKPEPVGSIRAVCPGRGKFQVCKIFINSNEKHTDWYEKVIKPIDNEHCKHLLLRWEAEKEGFRTWEGLLNWFNQRKEDINKTIRIAFMKVT